MSEYASQELSLELHQLSGWTDTDKYWFYEDSHPDLAEWELATHDMDGKAHPAYDAGYLLRKLPLSTDGGKWKLSFFKTWHNGKQCEWYTAGYVHINSSGIFESVGDVRSLHMVEADTPENCLAMLCVELHKAGILPISGRD